MNEMMVHAVQIQLASGKGGKNERKEKDTIEIMNNADVSWV